MTRNKIAEHIQSPLLNEILEGGLVRFASVKDKYQLGVVVDVQHLSKKEDKVTKDNYTFVWQQTMPGKLDSAGNPVKKAVSIETNRVLIVKVGDVRKKEHQTLKRVLVAHLSNGEPIAFEREVFLRNFGYLENSSEQDLQHLPYRSDEGIAERLNSLKELLDGKHTQAQKERFHVRRLDIKLS